MAFAAPKSKPWLSLTALYHLRRYGLAFSPRSAIIALEKSANFRAPASMWKPASVIPSSNISGSSPVLTVPSFLRSRSRAAAAAFPGAERREGRARALAPTG